MLKTTIPLQASKSHGPAKPKQEALNDPCLKSKPLDSFDCDEDIEVINMPISVFSCREPFQSIPFESSPPSPWCPSDSSYMQALLHKELSYMPNPYYLQTMQPYLSPHMRLVLYDWMMEVCSELTLKRETFHLSVNYVDRYLSRCPAVRKQDYQLIGLSCMYLAAKVEEVLPPFLADWATSADNGYSPDMITQMEKALLRALDFKVFPATCHNWTNWLMTQWDLYVDFHFGCVLGNSVRDFEHFADRKKVKEAFEERMILFKQANQKAYKRFRETMQILDVSMLHTAGMRFVPSQVACGLMYLMISKYFYETNYEMLYYTGDCRDYLDRGFEGGAEIEGSLHAESTAAVQELFAEFIRAAVEIENIEEIYGSVTFFHPFLEFEAVYDLPVVCKMQTKAKLESHYEDFLAYQTHNIKNLDFITNTLKDY